MHNCSILCEWYVSLVGNIVVIIVVISGHYPRKCNYTQQRDSVRCKRTHTGTHTHTHTHTLSSASHWYLNEHPFEWLHNKSWLHCKSKQIPEGSALKPKIKTLSLFDHSVSRIKAAEPIGLVTTSIAFSSKIKPNKWFIEWKGRGRFKVNEA